MISICSDGETLLPKDMIKVIYTLLEEGHYIMVVTNGMLRNRIKECLSFEPKLQDRLFFKLSMHYEELVRLNQLDYFFENVKMIQESPCSFTVEAVAGDETLEQIETFKTQCMENLGVLPQFTVPRDDRRFNRGLASKHSLDNYKKEWEKTNIDSSLFDLRINTFGKKYRAFCYAGSNYLWVNLADGYSRQCYDAPRLQNFMGEKNKKVKWLAIGHNCPDIHCRSSHLFMPLGIAPYPFKTSFVKDYFEIRNRKTKGGNWVKKPFEYIFKKGCIYKPYSNKKKGIVDIMNNLFLWRNRKHKDIKSHK